MTDDNWGVGDILICNQESGGGDFTKYNKGDLVQILSIDSLSVQTINTRGGMNGWWKTKFTWISSGTVGDLSRVAQL